LDKECVTPFFFLASELRNSASHCSISRSLPLPGLDTGVEDCCWRTGYAANQHFCPSLAAVDTDALPSTKATSAGVSQIPNSVDPIQRICNGSSSSWSLWTNVGTTTDGKMKAKVVAARTAASNAHSCVVVVRHHFESKQHTRTDRAIRQRAPDELEKRSVALQDDFRGV
jgi:hypothetical protein